MANNHNCHDCPWARKTQKKRKKKENRISNGDNIAGQFVETIRLKLNIPNVEKNGPDVKIGHNYV